MTKRGREAIETDGRKNEQVEDLVGGWLTIAGNKEMTEDDSVAIKKLSCDIQSLILAVEREAVQPLISTQHPISVTAQEVHGVV